MGDVINYIYFIWDILRELCKCNVHVHTYQPQTMFWWEIFYILEQSVLINCCLKTKIVLCLLRKFLPLFPDDFYITAKTLKETRILVTKCIMIYNKKMPSFSSCTRNFCPLSEHKCWIYWYLFSSQICIENLPLELRKLNQASIHILQQKCRKKSTLLKSHINISELYILLLHMHWSI